MAYISKEEIRDVPIMGIMSQAIGCMYIQRGATQEIRDEIVEQIGQRQKIIEEFGEYPPVVIFPEGGTSNGSCILSFKRGAFASSKAVTPVIVKYNYGLMSPAYDVAPYLALAIMTMMVVDIQFEVIQLPTFVPNDYLYQTHGDKVLSSSDAPRAVPVLLQTEG